MKYYSTSRPIMVGGYPNSKDVVAIVNFDQRQYCEEIAADAWGYIVYSGEIPEADVNNYELTPTDLPVWYCVTSAFYDSGKVVSNITSVERCMVKPESTYKETKRCDIYCDWFATREEAEAWVKDALNA